MNGYKSKQGNKIKRTLSVTTLFIFVFAGCQTLPRESRMMKQEAPGIKVSAAELRIRVQALAIPFSGVIADAADEIMAKSADQNVRRHALLWKMNAIPALFTAIFQPEPAVAALDVWAFSEQMVGYFGQGPGKEALGKYHTIALEASQQINTKVMDLARSVSVDSDLSRPKAAIQSWAARHPITSPFFHRESVVKEFADIIAESDLTALAAVGKLTVGMDDLAAWVAVYSEYLPNQARWQVELLLMESSARGGIDVQVEELAMLSESLERVIPIVEKSPEFVSRERGAVLKALREERVATLESINEQRIATLESIDLQRFSTLEWFTQERIATIAALRQERIDATKDIEATSSRIIDTGFMNTEGMIDHFFLRTAQLLVGLLIIALVIGIFAVRYIKKKDL
jgi:hypothetical protein